MDGASSADHDPLEALVFEALERLESEGPAGLDALLASHPEQADALRQRVEALARVGLVGSTPAVEHPKTFGEFTIERPLGEGGMGLVYLARQPSLGRRVALKLVRPEHLYFPGARDRFRREIEAVARLSHPNVVAVYSAGDVDGVPYFAMEAVEGVSLATLLTRLEGKDPKTLTGADLYRCLVQCLGELGLQAPSEIGGDGEIFRGSWPKVATRIALCVARALEHAHGRGVLHRDVKPANVLITAEGRVVLVDFGLANLSGSQRLTRTGSALGSLPYMAPEQLRSNGEADVRTDVWSTGVTYYELLTLCPPFDGDSDGALFQAIQRAHPRHPRQLHGGLSSDASTVCLKALEGEPQRRYPTAAALAMDLEAVLELRPVSAQRPGLWRGALKWGRRHPGQAVAAAALALLLVVGPLSYAAIERKNRRALERANSAAEAANQDLALALSDLRVERDRVEEQRERAQRNFERALTAVDTMLRRTAEARLLDIPRTATLRRELLEQALAFHTELLGEEPSDLRAREERARSLQRAGDLRMQLGALPDAIEALGQSASELKAVLAESARGELLGLELARAHELLAVALARTGALAEAAAHFQSALDVLASHPPGSASASTAKKRWYDVAIQLCQARADLGEPEAAGAELDRIAAEIAVSAPPLKESLWAQSIDASLTRGILAVRTGDVEGAELALERTRDLCASLEAQHGTSPVFRRALASTLETQALLANQQRHWQLAALRLDAAIELFERYVADEPDVPAWSSRLAGLLGTRAANALLLDSEADTSGDENRAIGLLEDLVQRFPHEPSHLQRLAIAYGERAVGRFGAEAEADGARAISLLERALSQRPDNGQLRSNLVVSLANGASLAQERGDLELARARCFRALELLEGATFGESRRQEIEVRCSVADVLRRAQDPGAARSQLERAATAARLWCESRPSDRAAHGAVALVGVSLGAHLLQEADPDGARSALLSALPSAQRAAETGERHPKDILALLWLRLCEAERRRGDMEAARQAFRDAVERAGATRESLAPYPSLQALFDDPDLGASQSNG